MGRLTTHVLDTATGKPGAGVSYELYRLDSERRLLTTGATNEDGRCDAPLLDESSFAKGTYELVFDVAPYFAKGAPASEEAPFLALIPIRINMSRDEHYHVPLLVSPWSYSTYRGS